MNTEFIHKNSRNLRLIIIFSGWSCDRNMFREIHRTGWDILVCWGYDDFNFDKTILKEYKTIYLYAWSLGVFAAEKSLAGVEITKAFAINGTPLPVSDSFGIPQKIYSSTTETLSERNLYKFRIRMCGGIKKFEEKKNLFPTAYSIPVLRSQLEVVHNAMSESGEHKIRWDKAFIYTDDLIFPSENQIRYWDGKADTYITEGSHCPDFLEIIDHTLPDILTIKDQFHKSRGTYDKNALAQRDIARNLLSLLSEWNPANRSNILEIGSGTGILTSLYMSGLNPGKVTLVDLVHSENTRACDQMEYIEADAETWISMTQNKWDIVLSSSTIQWFSDLKRFIINCQRVLNPGGILAISGFTQGNLSEFDHIRNNPLAYPTKKEVVTILSGLFKEFKVTDEEMKVTFPTKRDALLHLKKTGVSTTHTRSGDAAIGLKSISDCIPSDEQGNVFLTYRPLYILARK